MDKLKIKVVKKTETETPKIKRSASPRVAAREMVATVSDWVSDLKQRKSEETRAAIDMLFAAKSRPSES